MSYEKHLKIKTIWLIVFSIIMLIAIFGQLAAVAQTPKVFENRVELDENVSVGYFWQEGGAWISIKYDGASVSQGDNLVVYFNDNSELYHKAFNNDQNLLENEIRIPIYQDQERKYLTAEVVQINLNDETIALPDSWQQWDLFQAAEKSLKIREQL